MNTAMIAGLAIVAGFAAIHVFIGRLRKLDVEPRSGWLSFAGGTAVAYVFLHVLPELAEHQQEYQSAVMLGGANVEVWIYALSMLGLAVYYGVERWAKLTMAKADSAPSDGASEAAAHNELLWVHTGSFAIYNLLIGYLLFQGELEGGWPLALYAIAMGLHFLTTDHGMRQHHPGAYDRVSRWVLAAAVFAGWLLGMAYALPPLVIGCLFAFLAGGVVLNVMKEELPEERESRFGPFLGGAVFYAALLVAEGVLG